jgi:hypothetical protein
LVELAGPEEMKWPNKSLYTYNVRNGDKFIVDEKVPLTRLRTRNSSSMSLSPVNSPSKNTMTFQIAPRIPGFNCPPTATGNTPGPRTPNARGNSGPPSAPSPGRATAAANVARNLFGSAKKKTSKDN